MLKDCWGNDALDYGLHSDLTAKYPDKILVTLSNGKRGYSYVLYICDAGEVRQAEKMLADYKAAMHAKGVAVNGAGISLGANLMAAHMARSSVTMRRKRFADYLGQPVVIGLADGGFREDIVEEDNWDAVGLAVGGRVESVGMDEVRFVVKMSRVCYV